MRAQKYTVCRYWNQFAIHYCDQQQVFYCLSN